jgi:hypothetical protein
MESIMYTPEYKALNKTQTSRSLETKDIDSLAKAFTWRITDLFDNGTDHSEVYKRFREVWAALLLTAAKTRHRNQEWLTQLAMRVKDGGGDERKQTIWGGLPFLQEVVW